MKKKLDKSRLLTVSVVVILCAIFVIGFIWGLGNVLAMEGSYPPVINAPGMTPAPENAEQVVAYLNAVVEKAAAEKPSVQSGVSYGIDGDSVETTGSDTVKTTLLYLADSFTGYLGDESEKFSADYYESSDSFLRKPAFTAADVESFTCDYIYYVCPSCGIESEEYLPNCEKCGGLNEYNMKYRDDYVITVNLKVSDGAVKNNFAPKTAEERLAMLGDEMNGSLKVNNVDVGYETLTVKFVVERVSDKLKSLEYSKSMNVKSGVTFDGGFKTLGNADVSFILNNTDGFYFTWPALTLSDHEMTVEPKKGDNLLATLTCDNPLDYTVTWKSSDEELLTVDEEGYFKAGKGTGTATITASFEFGGKTYSDECVVSVKKSVESLKMNKKKVELNVGETCALRVKFSPKDATIQTLKWYTEDEKIATVDENGVVTAVGQGTVTVYALSDDGYFKSSSEVTVK